MKNEITIKFISLNLALAIIVSFTGCNDNSTLTSSKELNSGIVSIPSNSSQTAEEPVQPVFPGVEVLELDYRVVISPVIVDTTLYMAVSEERIARDDADARHLISYDTETKATEYLFESNYASANIQQISCDGKWLVWCDQEIWGSSCEIYVMDLESREIKKIDSFKPEATSFLIPKLQSGRVYWIKEEGFNEDQNKIYGSVYEYNCETEIRKKIYSLDYIDFYNISVGVGSGKVVWSETVNDVGTLFLYDIKSGKITEYPTNFKYACSPLYSNGYAKFQGQNDFSNRFELPNHNYWYNTKTGEITEIEALDDFMFAMSENYAATSCGTIIYYYKKKGDDLILLEPYTVERGDCKFSENDIFINCYEKNKKNIIYINRLDEFPEKT